MEINFAEILKALKDIGKLRFYFIVVIFAISFFIYIFREDVSAYFKEDITQKIEFREIKDLGGLEKSLDVIVLQEEDVEAYIVYMYQPKEYPFYKSMLLTDSELVKSINSLQGVYLDEQEYINELLKRNDFILLSKEDAIEDTRYIHAVGINYLLIKKLMYENEIIGEIHLLLKNKPTEVDLMRIYSLILPLKYIYII